MNNPENTQQPKEQPNTPEAFIAEEIMEGLRKLRSLHARLARGEDVQGTIDTVRDTLHKIIDDGAQNMEWFGRRDEVGDMNPERFQR